jgi:hypothetical protein
VEGAEVATGALGAVCGCEVCANVVASEATAKTRNVAALRMGDILRGSLRKL